jgi:hypothetical protein
VTAPKTLLLLGIVLAAGAARAEPTVLSFEQAIYQDSKEGPLKTPEGVACSDAGVVVVADTGNARLVTYALSGGRLSGGTEVKVAQLAYPVRVQLDSKGNILALDAKTRRIVRLDAKGAFLGTLEIKGIINASSIMPAAFKVDSSDNVLVLDVAARRVIVLDPTGTSTRQIALPKTGQFTDIAEDLAGTIYAVDGSGASVWAADKGATTFSAVAQNLKDRMNFPAYIAASKGKLFLVDQHGNGIVTLGIDGSFQGRQLAIGWSDGLVYYPSQLCLTDAGAMFVADRYNNRVQMFSMAK